MGSVQWAVGSCGWQLQWAVAVGSVQCSVFSVQWAVGSGQWQWAVVVGSCSGQLQLAVFSVQCAVAVGSGSGQL
ncbi:MAG: hypothetical protein WBA61_04505 [Aequorivita sp.]